MESNSQGPVRIPKVIPKKRDGKGLSRAEIDFLIHGYTWGKIPDSQAAAWLMATALRGLTREETASLTDAMLHSGEVLDLSALSATVRCMRHLFLSPNYHIPPTAPSR